MTEPLSEADTLQAAIDAIVAYQVFCADTPTWHSLEAVVSALQVRWNDL